VSGLDLDGFDRSIRPQDDLYRFALAATGWREPEIPPDRSNYGTFSKLEDDAKITRCGRWSKRQRRRA
jgi:predicted metalloendopeptidase